MKVKDFSRIHPDGERDVMAVRYLDDLPGEEFVYLGIDYIVPEDGEYIHFANSLGTLFSNGLIHVAGEQEV